MAPPFYSPNNRESVRQGPTLCGALPDDTQPVSVYRSVSKDRSSLARQAAGFFFAAGETAPRRCASPAAFTLGSFATAVG